VPLLSHTNRRKRNLLIIAGFLFLVAVANLVNTGAYAPDLPLASNITVFALLNLNLIVLLLLVVLLFRNLVKLWFERRQNVIGAKFKTKLVLAFLSVSLVPAILIFLIASNFINKSIEGWFKPQVERPLDQALAVAQTYYNNLERTALRHAQHLGRVIDRNGLLDRGRRDALATYLVEAQEQLGMSAITVFSAQGHEFVHVKDPVLGDQPTREVNESQLKRALAGQEVTTVREIQSGDLIEAFMPIWSQRGGAEPRVAGVIVVATHVAERLEARVRAISQAFQEYKQVKLLKTPIKGIYILLFLLMTLIVVFSFAWFGLYLARGITVPIAELAEGTREVAAGHLSYKVQARANDELGVLVHSFNRMTDDLAESNRRLEEAYLDLSDKHTELEDRRRYTETVLEALSSGVVSFDPLGRLTTINRAAARMFGVTEGAVGRLLEEVFAGPDVRHVVALVQRTRRPKAGAVEQELHLRRGGTTLSLLASATALPGPEGEYAGAVVVFDDLTELLKAQRVAAWREVAQRIAHEIKNPLTPIQLSAQRLRRRLARSTGEDAQLVVECTGTIIQEVDGLRRLVDEFSRFARMPTLAPRLTDLRPLVESVVALYREAQPALTLVTRHAEDLPPVEVDPDHIKRAVLNLVENAVEAVGGAGEVSVKTAHVPETGHARIIVTDTGSGISPEDKEKLFLPYFSTKAEGMGLGLPIVWEIVTEHGGTIRVEDNEPRGSRFIIEVPVARTPAPVEA
jgi:two-component system, NtrC family, nitrogen regulation sensor histidine kinase NtrY